MSLLTNMTEVKKILAFLEAKGITTLEQLKSFFEHCKNEAVQEEVVFVKEMIAPPYIIQEKMAIEVSNQNKVEINNVLNKQKQTNTAEILQQKVVQQSDMFADLGRYIITAGHAVNALNPVNAENAGYARNTGHAMYAVNGENAINAVNAGYAGNSVSAMNAGYARNAENTGNAVNAVNSENSGNGMNAVNAGYAENVVNAGNTVNAINAVSCEKKNSLPMRYRHKNSNQNNPYSTRQTRSNLKLQQREQIRQAEKICQEAQKETMKRMASGVSTQYLYHQNTQNQLNQCTPNNINHFSQNNANNHLNKPPHNYNDNALSHRTYAGDGQNIAIGFNNATGLSSDTSFNNATFYRNDTGFNNATGNNSDTGFSTTTGYNRDTGFNNATRFNNAGFVNPIGRTIPLRKPITDSVNPTHVRSTASQQTWPTAALMDRTGQRCNCYRCRLDPQAQSQQPCSQYYEF